MKSFLRGILFLVFFVSLTIGVLIFPLKKPLFSSSYLKNEIKDHNLYEIVYNSSPQLADIIFQKNPSDGPSQEGLTPSQTVNIFKNSVSPEIIETKSEGLVDQAYDWIQTPSNRPLKLSLSDVKPKIEDETAKEIGIPVELVRAGALGEIVPTEYEIKMPLFFILIHYLKVNYMVLILSFSFISALSFIGFIWLKGPRISQKLKSAGFAATFTGTVGFLSTLGYWLFFNSSEVITRAVANWLKIPYNDASAFYQFFNHILGNYVFCLTYIAIGLIILGIASLVAAHYLRLSENKKFQKKETEKDEENNH